MVQSFLNRIYFNAKCTKEIKYNHLDIHYCLKTFQHQLCIFLVNYIHKTNKQNASHYKQTRQLKAFKNF